MVKLFSSNLNVRITTMARIKFNKGKQEIFFDSVRAKSNLFWSEIAKKCSVSTRTLHDWRIGKHNADYNTVRSLSKKYEIPLINCKKIDTYWYVHKGASLGGKARYEQYGPVGTVEDRRKGGKISQANRRDDPEKYRRMGCNVRKIFNKPSYSEELAEMVGIIMGDGSISNYQIRVTLDRKVDREYALFVSKIIHNVLNEKPTWSERDGVIELVLSGAGLVDMLEALGLKRGNKITNQIKIPDWIFSKSIYQRACLRGLFDTDGSIYKHIKSSGIYIGWTFTSYSLPIIYGVIKILNNHDFKFSASNKHRSLYMYSLGEVIKYMDIIKSSNPKHTKKVEKHKKYKKRRVAPNW